MFHVIDQKVTRWPAISSAWMHHAPEIIIHGVSVQHYSSEAKCEKKVKFKEIFMVIWIQLENNNSIFSLKVKQHTYLLDIKIYFNFGKVNLWLWVIYII